MHSMRNINIGRVMHRDICGIMHGDLLRQRHRVRYDDSVMHSMRNINIGRVMHRDICGIMHGDLLRQRHRVRYDDSVVSVNIGCVMHRHILCQRHSIGNNGSVVNGVWYINIGGVVDIYMCRVMHIHRVDLGSGRGRRRGRLLFAIGKLSTERQPYGVAGM